MGWPAPVWAAPCCPAGLVGKLFAGVFGRLVWITGAGPGRSGKYRGLIFYGVMLIVTDRFMAIVGVEPAEFDVS